MRLALCCFNLTVLVNFDVHHWFHLVCVFTRDLRVCPSRLPFCYFSFFFFFPSILMVAFLFCSGFFSIVLNIFMKTEENFVSLRFVLCFT